MNEQELREDIFNVLRVLSNGDDLSQRDLSNRLGVSLGKTNYLLKELVKKGLVKAKKFTVQPDKTKKIRYLVTKEGLDHRLKLTYYFLKRKEQEYLELKKLSESMDSVPPQIL